ncbi:hypothetical protein Sjap_007404 [Stephania japonica]|uniref:Ribulose bisphosphate carboxylase/oxygenase activase AAA helical domain-containing protein n=1 Tax=Stephania japonica TaxID=461633 RepID=A0AAP0PDP7_9MAGN
MYEKDGISIEAVVGIVETFPNQALDFYGALRSRTYDRSISKWVEDIGGFENLGQTLLKRKKDNILPTFIPQKVCYLNLHISSNLSLKTSVKITYNLCGVSCAGEGEIIIRGTLARDVAALMEYKSFFYV